MSMLKKGKVIRSQGREIVANVIRFMDDEKRNQSPNLEFRKSNERVAAATGVSLRTVNRIRSQDNYCNILSTPAKKRPRKAHKRDLDEFDKCVVRRTIHEMYTTKEIPILSALLKKLKERIDFEGERTTLHKILHDLGFKWKRWSGRKYLMEREDIIAKRRQFIRELKRNEALPVPKTVVYQDETWILTTHVCAKGWQDCSTEKASGLKVPTSKGSRFIICHAGTKDGFIDGASLIFDSAMSTGDYHNDMNAETFRRWFENQLLPNLPPTCIIIMDNAPYHCMLVEKAPTTNWRKADIQSWLKKHNITFEPDMLKAELLRLVRESNFKKRFVIDEIAAAHGHKVLRLPPYHCDLNAIELIWADAKGYVARNNTEFTKN